MKHRAGPTVLDNATLVLPELPENWEWFVTDSRTSNKNIFNPPLTVYLSNDIIRMQFICSSYRTDFCLSKVADKLLKELNQALAK